MARALTAAEAAKRIGWTVEELLRSRARGLPPGNLAFMVLGEPMWSPEELIPVPEALTVAELRAEARALGIIGASKMKRAELIEALS